MKARHKDTGEIIELAEEGIISCDGRKFCWYQVELIPEPIDDFKPSLPSNLESEKPLGLEEEINQTYHDGSVTDTSDLDHNSYENIARHFAQWGAEHRGSSEIPKDLEEAAENYSIDGHESTTKVEYIRTYIEGKRLGFIAGAKWQEEQDLKFISEIHRNGYNLCKEQMMKGAVEGLFWNTPFPTICLVDCKNYNFKDNQKIRIIIVKED